MQNRKYILGDLTDAERARMDDLLLQDDSAYDEMLAEEDDLIDAYVRGELLGDELAAFEAAAQRSARLRERIELARVMHAGVPGAVPSHGIRIAAPVWYSLAAAIAIVSLVGVWALMRTQSSTRNNVPIEAIRQKPAGTVVPQTASAPPQIASSAEQPVPSSAAPPAATVHQDSPLVPVSIVTFVLSGATTRGNDEALHFVVPAEAREAALDVSLEGETGRLFNAVLRDARGREVWSQHDRPMSQLQSGQGIEVRVPARKLSVGRYELGVYDALSGDNEPVSFVEFEIAGK